MFIKCFKWLKNRYDILADIFFLLSLGRKTTQDLEKCHVQLITDLISPY